MATTSAPVHDPVLVASSGLAPDPRRADAEARGPLVALDHEELVLRRGRRSGVYTAIAVHSTALGPALGGCRMWRYPSSAEAARDALRLSRAMTFKAAAAGLHLGGGKGVICLPPGAAAPQGPEREAVLLDFADTVEALAGSYITAEDVGTSTLDMVVIGRDTSHVVGLPADGGGSGDPSPFTAAGVLAAMRAACARRFGTRELAERSVAVIGCGRVGEQLARQLAGEGARLVLCDIDPARAALADELPNATWIADPAQALLADVDVLAPCALGGVIDALTAPRIAAGVVCGSANNQLADDSAAATLADRGIVYAPDFIANAGGLINVSLELEGYDASRARERVAGIEAAMERVFDAAESGAGTPLEAAYAVARERLGKARSASSTCSP